MKQGEENPLEHPEIGDCAWQLELTIRGGGHGQVDTEETGGEDQEHAESGCNLPFRQRKLFEFGFLPSWGIILFRILFVLEEPTNPRVYRQIPRSRH